MIKDTFIHSLYRVLLNIFAHELLGAESPTFKVSDLFNAINGVHDRCSGAYAVVAIIAGYGLVAFRDIHGIRPLILGRKRIHLAIVILFLQKVLP